MKVIASTDRAFKAAVLRVVTRASLQGEAVENSVRTILKAVQRGGDSAVIRYTKKFDRVALKPNLFRVTPEGVKEAYYQIRKEEGDALRYAAQRIMAFHEKQRTKTWMYQDNGATLGQVVMPLDSVGIYVPGGKAVYPSSVLMSAIPAKVAGVKRVVMCTPASKTGISPYLLVAADIAGVDEVYRIGGVQAIGAMAYGTKTIAKVDKVLGPGNIYVATAKRLVYGSVDIDMIAGPSELCVLADEAANPAQVAADLLCEAEHDEEAKVYLVTTSERLAKDGELGGKDFEVMALSIDRAGVHAVEAFFMEIGVKHLRLYIDQSMAAMRKLAVVGLPTTLLIDREGREVWRYAGAAEWDSDEWMGEVRRAIEKKDQ